MDRAKFFNGFMIFALVGMSVWPTSGQAFDLFGNESQKQISYYQGYNDAMKLAATTYELPVKTSVDSAKSYATQNEVDQLEAKINSLELLVNGDDWGIDPLPAYVTNPMTADLDVGNYVIGNYGSDLPVFFDGNIEVEGITQLDGNVSVYGNMNLGPALPGKLSVLDEVDNGITVSVGANGDSAKAGFFQANGDDSMAVYGIASAANGSWAGFFDGQVFVDGQIRSLDIIRSDRLAVGDEALNSNFHPTAKIYVSTPEAGDPGAIAFHARVGTAGNMAGLFDGDVRIIQGDLITSRIKSDTEAVYFDTDVNLGAGTLFGRSINLTSMEPNRTLLQAQVFGNQSTAGYFTASGDGSRAIYAIATSTNSGVTYAGWFNGDVRIMDGDLRMENGAISLAGQNGDGVVIGGDPYTMSIQTIANDSIGLNIRASDVGDNQAASIHGITSMWSTPEDNRPTLSVMHQDNTALFVDGRVGIGTNLPNKDLHILSHQGNAEIDIQSGWDNTHWGIYQDRDSGNLSFWHGDNKVTFTDKGINANGLCLDGVCISQWKQLKKILDGVNVIDPNIYPYEEVPQ